MSINTVAADINNALVLASSRREREAGMALLRALEGGREVGHLSAWAHDGPMDLHREALLRALKGAVCLASFRSWRGVAALLVKEDGTVLLEEKGRDGRRLWRLGIFSEESQALLVEGARLLS